MKTLKIVGIVIGSAIFLFMVVFSIYLLMHKQAEAKEFEVGKRKSEKSILIASQGSDFKNALVEKLVDELEGDSVYIKVVDVSGLSDISEGDWDASIIIHTTEGWKLQPDVKDYLDSISNPERIILVTTSGSGEWKTDEYNLDIYTSASKISTVDSLAGSISTDVKNILKQNKEEDTGEKTAE